jgi:hypothetical protein
MASDWPPSYTEHNPGQISMEPPSQLTGMTSVTSVTTALRAHQRIENEQKAISELRTLTEQLIDLPERIMHADMVSTQAQRLQEAMIAFTQLAAFAWQGLATGTFDEVTATMQYRQHAVAAARRINQVQISVTTSRPLDDELLYTHKSSAPMFWRSRVAIYAAALHRWRDAMESGSSYLPDPAYLGDALEALSASVGQGSLNGSIIFVSRFLTGLTLTITAVVTAILLFAGTSALILQDSAQIPRAVASAGLGIILWCIMFWLTTASDLSFPTLTGSVVWQLHEREEVTKRHLLLGWRLISGIVGLVLTICVLGVVAWQFALAIGQNDGPLHSIQSIGSVHDALVFIDGPAYGYMIAVATCALFPIIVALPTVIAYQVFLARGLSGFETLKPSVRRVTLSTALHLLLIAVGTFLAILGITVRAIGITWASWLPISPLSVGIVSVIASVGIIALYLIAVEIPYRKGCSKWRISRIAKLTDQIRDLEARLSRSTAEPTDSADAATFQYDVARMQYLQLQISSVRHEPIAPYGAIEVLAALFVVLLTGVLFENGLLLGGKLFGF